MNDKEILKAVIGRQHGWAVESQMKDILDGDGMDSNPNAVRHMKKTLESIINGDNSMGAAAADMLDLLPHVYEDEGE
jgi:hypothetical protein